MKTLLGMAISEWSPVAILEPIALGWLFIAAGTFIFFSVLALHALRNGGAGAYKKLQIGFAGILLVMVAASICWPWTWVMVRNMVRFQKEGRNDP